MLLCFELRDFSPFVLLYVKLAARGIGDRSVSSEPRNLPPASLLVELLKK